MVLNLGETDFFASFTDKVNKCTQKKGITFEGSEECATYIAQSFNKVLYQVKSSLGEDFPGYSDNFITVEAFKKNQSPDVKVTLKFRDDNTAIDAEPIKTFTTTFLEAAEAFSSPRDILDLFEDFDDKFEEKEPDENVRVMGDTVVIKDWCRPTNSILSTIDCESAKAVKKVFIETFRSRMEFPIDYIRDRVPGVEEIHIGVMTGMSSLDITKAYEGIRVEIDKCPVSCVALAAGIPKMNIVIHNSLLSAKDIEPLRKVGIIVERAALVTLKEASKENVATLFFSDLRQASSVNLLNHVLGCRLTRIPVSLKLSRSIEQGKSIAKSNYFLLSVVSGEDKVTLLVPVRYVGDQNAEGKRA